MVELTTVMGVERCYGWKLITLVKIGKHTYDEKRLAPEFIVKKQVSVSFFEWPFESSQTSWFTRDDGLF